MVRIFGISIGEKDEKDEKSQVCKHPLFKRSMRLNPEKQKMELYCKQCGQVVEEEQ